MLAQGLLTTWSNTSDPCDDGWAFVSCNCTDTYPVLSPSDCTAAKGTPSSRRVLVLAVSGVIRTRGRKLHGPISAAIANLTELRIFDLHDNALSVSSTRVCQIPRKTQTLPAATLKYALVEAHLHADHASNA